jgi:hypothetical protein
MVQPGQSEESAHENEVDEHCERNGKSSFIHVPRGAVHGWRGAKGMGKKGKKTEAQISTEGSVQAVTMFRGPYSCICHLKQ